MKLSQKFKAIPKWILTYLSIATMVMMPIAQGEAAQRAQQEISKAMVQNAIYEMGLNKSMTYGEFFKKNKDKYPARLQKELAPYFAKFANQPMPQFDVGTVKGSDGLMHPTVRISQNGQLHNVQIFGETERYAKFNNTTLTEVDLINFDEALIRLTAGDEKLRQQLETPVKTETKKFSSFPDITKASWTQLTPEQRAGYVISMRLLYNDAHGVLLAAKHKNKATKGKKYSWLQSLMTEAVADPGDWDNDDNIGAKTSSVSVSNLPNQGLDSCLVAGYVTSYKGQTCKYTEMVKNYTDVSSLARKAYAACGSGKQIACNPLVFGAPNGKAICIDRANNADVQIATHYEGPCERNNHTNSKISFLNDENDKTGRYAVKNLKKTADQIKEEAKAEQQKDMYQATKDYLAGVLEFKDKSLYDLFIAGKPDQKVLDELLSIKKGFDSEIKQATEACKAASVKQTYHEKNFWGACDQLQRRFIFVAEYLSKNPGCKDKKDINPETLKCSCDDKTEVLPGETCKIPPPTPVETKCPLNSRPSNNAGNCICKDAKGFESEFPATAGQLPSNCISVPNPPNPPGPGPGVLKCDPECNIAAGEKCVEEDFNGIKSLTCVKDKKLPLDPKKKKKGFGQFLEKALPWVVGVGALVGMYFLFKPKQPKLNPAGDLCPNGTVAPCSTTCKAPQVEVAGSCVCAACPPGQTIINASTCQCGTQDNDVKIVCPDGVTIVDKLEDCPTVKYTCWDGSQVDNAINCPEKPVNKIAPVQTGQ